MNKCVPLQRNKLFTAYGGVGSLIDTIDNLSIIVEPFDTWPYYDNLADHRELLLEESRLLTMLRSIGFINLVGLFQPDVSLSDNQNFKPYRPSLNDRQTMVRTSFFPTWFYCRKCHRFMSLSEWEEKWTQTHDKKFRDYHPACFDCGLHIGGGKYRRPRLQQTRFVLASLDSGEIIDVPWKKVFAKHKQGRSDSNNASVWNFDIKTDESSTVYYKESNDSTNLSRIYVENEYHDKVFLSEIFKHYFVIGGKSYRLVVRSESNVYYAYNVNSVYIPRHVFTNDEINRIGCIYRLAPNNPNTLEQIRRNLGIDCSVQEIETLIENDFNYTPPRYTSEADFRKEEFKLLTDVRNYNNGVYVSPDNVSLISNEYIFKDIAEKPRFINTIFYQTRLKVTSAQVAYSRIEKISSDVINDWQGQNNPPKLWYNINTDCEDDNVQVKLHPTCKQDISELERMMALSSYGEGFLVEMDLNYIIEPSDKKTFLHTFCHLLMKEIEFVCGYPVASMSERLYTNENEQIYGFMIYSIGSSGGSFGGISSLFQDHRIEGLINNAIKRASDCSNDPICSLEGGHCEACVYLPETTCEQFNNDLNRNLFNHYK